MRTCFHKKTQFRELWIEAMEIFAAFANAASSSAGERNLRAEIHKASAVENLVLRTEPTHNPKRLIGVLFAVLCGIGMLKAEEKNAFGETKRSETALIGVLYDLKQTQNHTPTPVDAGSYSKVVDEFLGNDWDEAVLNKYYRVAAPLYTTQIFMPMMQAGAAPKAFGVEKIVKPSRWLIHYKGQVSPPSAGSYRFWGCADDVIAVAVNGKTVLVGNRPDTLLPSSKWKASDPDGARAANNFLRPGDWMDLKINEIIDLDVIVGERPGGLFNAFLMIEKKGQSYEKDTKGFSIFPIFQVAAYDTPVIKDLGVEPLFAKGFPPWKSYQ